MSVTRSKSVLISAAVMLTSMGIASAVAAQTVPIVITVPSQQLAEAGTRVAAAQMLNQVFASGLERTAAAMAMTPAQERRWGEFANALMASMTQRIGPSIDIDMEPLTRARVRLERDRRTYEAERVVTDRMVRLYKVLNPDQQALLNSALDSLGQLSISAVGPASTGAYE